MTFVVCEGRAFIKSGALEKISDSVPVHVVSLDGKALSGGVVLLPLMREGAESVFLFREGKGSIGGELVKNCQSHKVFLSVGNARLFAGEIRVIQDHSLGACILPVRGDAERLWDCLDGVSEYVQILREKMESHIDGADIV